jgi:acyl-CoA synthetase (NDP forming)
VLTVRAGHSATDQALFEQAGVIAAGSFGELTETVALLATQPVPAGRSVAIVSNVGGAGVLAADACADLGLTVHQPRGLTRRRLRTLLPSGTVTGPVETTAAVSAGDFRRCLELLAADDGVDAMIALVQPTGANGDLMTAIQDADIRVPLAAVALDQAEAVRLMPRSAADGQIPVYDVPEAAVTALAHAARYGAWRTSRTARCPASPTSGPRMPARWSPGFLHREPGGGWLPPDKTADLLHCYGIWLVDAELLPGAKMRRSRPPGRCPARWCSRPRCKGSRRRPAPTRWNLTCTPRPRCEPPTTGWPTGSAAGSAGS